MADSFALDVKKFADSFIDGSEQAVRGTVIKLSGAIVDSSPVDEGRFRGNWFLTGAEPSVRMTNRTDRNGKKTKKEMEDNALSIKDWSLFHITNNLPYGPVIEFGGYGPGPKTVNGYSRQSPQGVVRVNISRFNSLLEDQARGALPR